MMNKLSSLLRIFALAGLTGLGVAQTANTPGTGPGVVDPGHPRVNQVNRREARQQGRIANGINNGSMSAKQASNLEKREANVQKREQKDMAAHNGHLTKAEQKGINRQQNRISKTIYKDKHK